MKNPIKKKAGLRDSEALELKKSNFSERAKIIFRKSSYSHTKQAIIKYGW